jgi:hypothetical protein
LANTNDSEAWVTNFSFIFDAPTSRALSKQICTMRRYFLSIFLPQYAGHFVMRFVYGVFNSRVDLVVLAAIAQMVFVDSMLRMDREPSLSTDQ